MVNMVKTVDVWRHLLLNGINKFSYLDMIHKLAGHRKWGPWHEWFAWYPIRYKGKLYWFTKIWRRLRCENWEPLSCVTYAEYNTLEDYLATK